MPICAARIYFPPPEKSLLSSDKYLASFVIMYKPVFRKSQSVGFFRTASVLFSEADNLRY
jgi:hypothetical protein